MKKKGRIAAGAALLCLMAAFLIGWGKLPVELLNENPPLIDLSAAIKEAEVGQNGNTEGQTGDPDGQTPDGGDGDQGNQAKTHVIKVRDESVTYENDHSTFRTMENLKKKLKQNFHAGDTILLVDDYAEAHRYKEVLAALEELRDEKGYPYSAD